VNFLSFPVFVRKCERVKDEQYGRCVLEGQGLPVQEAGDKICRFIDKHQFSDSKKGPRWPLVALTFDEADTLTDNPPHQETWDLFSELRRVLRQIRHLQIFSLFLSTAGRFDKCSPDVHSDPSVRAREPDFRPLDPISEISFDDVAYPALKDTVTIDKVVGIDWISHLGRPSYVHPVIPSESCFRTISSRFGSYIDELDWHEKYGTEIMDYARQKLLGGSDELEEQNRAGSLACLSTRSPWSSTWTEQLAT
jgi:hypothetical protein